MELDEIRKHHDEVTGYAPSPWRWHGRATPSRPDYYLATANHGRIFVMGFRRAGFNGAEPWFPRRDDGFGTLRPARELVVREAPHRDDVADIDNPFAQYLQRAPEYIGYLLDEVERLRSQLDGTPVGGESGE